MHYMDTQLTLRLPKELGRRLNRQAKARGVKKSQLVREAVAAWLDSAEGPTAEEMWERAKPFIGVLSGNREAMMADPIARQMYERNFRE